MPPKKGQGGPSKKAENKAKEKVIEDKTFGLKNKKGGKQQKYIQQVEKQVKSGGNPDHRKAEAERLAEKKRKEEERQKAEETKNLFKPVQAQRVAAGVDPKSIFCAFFKQGLCKKGDKCKFSHDPEVERKSAKKNLYADVRDHTEDGMDDWDDDKLADVISKKHGAEKTNQTTIICKHFLDAVENAKYGWFWECPNGGKACMYRHALPPGFVLKKDKVKEEKGDTISIEDLIEKERAALGSNNLTKVTLETFIAWKKKKIKEKQMEVKNAEKQKKKDMKEGKMGGLSGRDMFSFDPGLVANGEEDDDGEEFDLRGMDKEEGEEYEGKVHEIKFDEFGIMDDGLDDDTATQLAAARVDGATAAVPVTTTVIDEDLFDDEDLDELEEDLDKLDI